MTALVEAHSAPEVDRAVQAGARLDRHQHAEPVDARGGSRDGRQASALVPDGILVVGESGVATREDVLDMEAAGVDAILVGEAVMRAPDPAAKIRELLGEPLFHTDFTRGPRPLHLDGR